MTMHELVHLAVDARVRDIEEVRKFLHGRGEPPQLREETDLLQRAALRPGYFLNRAPASRFLTHLSPQPSKGRIVKAAGRWTRPGRTTTTS
jgi:hypothetical protein